MLTIRYTGKKFDVGTEFYFSLFVLSQPMLDRLDLLVDLNK